MIQTPPTSAAHESHGSMTSWRRVGAAARLAAVVVAVGLLVLAMIGAIVIGILVLFAVVSAGLSR